MVPVWLVPEPMAESLFALITALDDIGTAKSFDRDLARLPADVRDEWETVIRPALSSDVAARGNFKRLKGHDDLYRVRLHGPYRVILRAKGSGTWVAERVGHRSKIYQGLR